MVVRLAEASGWSAPTLNGSALTLVSEAQDGNQTTFTTATTLPCLQGQANLTTKWLAVRSGL